MTASVFTVQEDGVGPEAGWLVLPAGEHRAAHALARVTPLRDAGDGDVPGGGAPGDVPAAGDAPGTRRASGPVTVRDVEERARALAARHADHPVLAVLGGDGVLRCTVRPEEPGPGPRAFAVLDAGGRPVGRVRRDRARWSRRIRWRVETAGGEWLVGHQGTVAGWLCFLVLLPLWCVCAGVSLLVTLVTLGEVSELVVWGTPRRTVWRRAGSARAALRFRHARADYAWQAEHLDGRLALAQALLHTVARLRS
ncbi:hypothetical protein V1J52_02055 [Streptomyces sp. TRM 70351]|uniref:hypothetical protein n=1 Tax=Streptomyces sp. TRM 70351 TaxID=3116552 RepID=UPI002E7AC4D6|nr:hypothetical protein [Streptomyces sp. TRM 70351]MEE1926973.1 hypothetical protein [Streptomyces sp. TRM 70351]